MKVQVVLCQNDEKWFYALVIRTHNTCVPIFEDFPVEQIVQHKSLITLDLHPTTTMSKGRRCLQDFSYSRRMNGSSNTRQLQACLQRGWNVPLSKDSRELAAKERGLVFQVNGDFGKQGEGAKVLLVETLAVNRTAST